MCRVASASTLILLLADVLNDQRKILRLDELKPTMQRITYPQRPLPVEKPPPMELGAPGRPSIDSQRWGIMRPRLDHTNMTSLRQTGKIFVCGTRRKTRRRELVS
jgi:hypothetical protein